MDYINLILADLPQGFWQNIIGVFVGFIDNYGVAIILFTIVLKLALIPLDFYQKKVTKKNSEKQKILQPKLKALQKKYGTDKNKLNQKTMELYKKENYSVFGTCMSVLLTMFLTLFIFITLFGAMRNISEYKIGNQYKTLRLAYYYELEGIDPVQGENQVSEDIDTIRIFDENITDKEELILLYGEETVNNASEKVLIKYNEIKDSFLWVNNIWRPDTNASIIPNYDNFIDLSKLSSEDVTELEYNTVMNILLEEEQGWNGYYILIILAGLITYFSVKIIQKTQPKPQAQDPNSPTVNTNIILLILPILMVVFTIQYSAAFAIYITINSLMSTIISIIIFKIIKDKNKNEITNVEYSRVKEKTNEKI